jgi:hypothetical protein
MNRQTQLFYLFWYSFVGSLSIFMKLLLSTKVCILSLYELRNSVTKVLPLSVFFNLANFLSTCACIIIIIIIIICLLRGLSPRANYTDRAAAAGRRS